MSFNRTKLQDLFRRTNWLDKLNTEDREGYINGLASIAEVTPLGIAQVADDIQSHTTEPWRWDRIAEVEHHLNLALN